MAKTTQERTMFVGLTPIDFSLVTHVAPGAEQVYNLLCIPPAVLCGAACLAQGQRKMTNEGLPIKDGAFLLMRYVDP